MPAPEPSAPPEAKLALTPGRAAALAGALVALAFARALGNGFVNYDDPLYVLYNEPIRHLDGPLLAWAFGGFHDSNWIPLTWLSLALDHAAWGLEPLGFHLTNVVLHAANAAMVALLACRLLAWRRGGAAQADGKGCVAALAAGLFFGVHPLRVESVAWITERKDVLCCFFLLLALLAYERWCRRRSADPPDLAFPWGAAGWTCLAALAKGMAVTMPALLLLLDLWPLRRLTRRAAPRLVLEKAPFILISAALSVSTILAQRGAVPSAAAGLQTRLYVAAKVALDYLRMTVWPSSLSPLYLHPGAVPVTSPIHLAALAALVALTGLAIWRARREPAWLVAWAWYGVALLPVIGLFQVGAQEKADRYTYLPCIGLALLVTEGLAWALGCGRSWRAGAALLACAWVAAMGVLTFRQIGFWKDGVCLWTRVLEVDPEVGMAWQHRGDARAFQGDLQAALDDYAVALEIAERKHHPRRGQVYAQRALLNARAQRPEQAIADATRALELSPEPRRDMLRLRAEAYARLGRSAEAEQDLRALQASPRGE